MTRHPPALEALTTALTAGPPADSRRLLLPACAPPGISQSRVVSRVGTHQIPRRVTMRAIWPVRARVASRVVLGARRVVY